MKTLISAKDIEDLLRKGGDLKSLPADAILTPSARDRLREFEGNGAYRPGNSTAPSSSRPINSKSSKSDLDAFFNSSPIQELKAQLCEVGRRLWQRAYVDGNGG